MIVMSIIVCLILGCYNKLPQIGWLAKQMFIPPILEAVSPKAVCQHCWILGKRPTPAIQMVAFLLCLHILGKERKFLCFYFKGTNQIHEELNLMPNFLLKASVPDNIILGKIWHLGFHQMNFEEHKHSIDNMIGHGSQLDVTRCN